MTQAPSIAFLSRKTLFSQPGGDTVQMVRTADALRKLGLNIEIFTDARDIKPGTFDLIHFFNLIRPADLLRLKGFKDVPLVVSTIFVDYSLADSSKGSYIRRTLGKFFGNYGLEYLKTIVRGLIGKDLMPPLNYWLKGQKKSITEILQKVDILITSTENEADRIFYEYGPIPRTNTIPLGVLECFQLPNDHVSRKGILCVGRIEPLKNQLALAEICRKNHWPLTLIGNASGSHQNYLKQCLKTGGANVKWIPQISQEELVRYYQTHQVHVGASFFETFHLASLEALSCGCRPVLSMYADSVDFFGRSTILANPSDLKDLEGKIKKALNQPVSYDEARHWQQYTWDLAAKHLLNVYAIIFPDRFQSCPYPHNKNTQP
jgi:glycosyltransferase involved in cell wall biosynthesis